LTAEAGGTARRDGRDGGRSPAPLLLRAVVASSEQMKVGVVRMQQHRHQLFRAVPFCRPTNSQALNCSVLFLFTRPRRRHFVCYYIRVPKNVPLYRSQ